jgi:glutamine amidotransferase
VTTVDPVIIGCCGANLASLTFALQRLGYEVPVTDDPDRVQSASHVLLPGVGAARNAMERLDAAGLSSVLPGLAQPVLGICLGMQLLFRSSREDDTACLGIIDAPVERLPDGPGLPVPEMGWNAIRIVGRDALLQGVDDRGYAYFVHSYAAPLGPHTLATADYGTEFTAVARQGNFYGTQFHPERSSKLGARILANFLALGDG